MTIKESFYRRNLPHWQPQGAEYFITFRLAGTLPQVALDKIKRYRKQLSGIEYSDDIPDLRIQIQRKIFQTYEKYLDEQHTGPTWLKNQEIAEVVKEAIHYRDRSKYDLYTYCIMPNHVHLVFKHLINENKVDKEDNSYPITDILRNMKRHTAYKCNQILNRKGAFWQSESYDRVIRDQDELENTIRYTLNNPVKAALVKTWKDWPHSYYKPSFDENT